jgi:uncharacterized protein DUF6228
MCRRPGPPRTGSFQRGIARAPLTRWIQLDEFLVIRSVSGSARLKLRSRKPADSAGPAESFYATLSLEGLRSSIRVHTPPYYGGPEGLAKLFEDIAANWRGWSGEKNWASLEGEMRISCTCDKLGHTRMAVLLRDLHPERGWTASGSLIMEAGQLDKIARSVREFLQA